MAVAVANERISEIMNERMKERIRQWPSSGSGGSGGSDSLSLCTELAAADAEERRDNPVGGMDSSGVVVQHEKEFQFGGSLVNMSEDHVSDQH